MGDVGCANIAIRKWWSVLFVIVTPPVPPQVALCGGYVAVQAELEMLVLKLDASSEPIVQQEASDACKSDYEKHETST